MISSEFSVLVSMHFVIYILSTQGKASALRSVSLDELLLGVEGS